MNERTTKTTLANIINNNGKNLEQTTATTRKKLVKVIQGKYIISTRLIGKSLPHFSHLYSSAKKQRKLLHAYRHIGRKTLKAHTFLFLLKEGKTLTVTYTHANVYIHIYALILILQFTYRQLHKITFILILISYHQKQRAK